MTKLGMQVLFLIVIASSGIIKAFQAASLQAFNVTPMCFCTKELAPVCDNYGMEYSNTCTFQCIKDQNSSIVLGCSHSCPCETTSSQRTTESTLSSGITNFLLEVTKRDPDIDCLCTKELAPVCDINGMEYSNTCTFECLTGRDSSISLACNHRCPCEVTASEKINQTMNTTWETDDTMPEEDNVSANTTTPEQGHASTIL